MKHSLLNVQHFSFKQVKKGISHNQRTVQFKGQTVLVTDTFNIFLKKGNCCVNCGIEGDLVVIEKDTRTFTNPTVIPHFKLYHVTNEGDLVLMTKDHIVPASISNNHNIENLQPMCTICNGQKADENDVNPNRPPHTFKPIIKVSKNTPLIIRGEHFWTELSSGKITYEKFINLLTNGYFEDETSPSKIKLRKIHKTPKKQQRIINDILSSLLGELVSMDIKELQPFFIMVNGRFKGITSEKYNIQIQIPHPNKMTVVTNYNNSTKNNELDFKLLTPENKKSIHQLRTYIMNSMYDQRMNKEPIISNKEIIKGTGKILGEIREKTH